MQINFNLLRSFRKNLKALKIAKKELESELFHLRSEIKNYELAIDYIERNIKRNKNAKPRGKNSI
jgi:hypothetical protein